MSGILPFVAMLEREETAVKIEETADTRYYVATYSFIGDPVDYRVEYFDSVPVVLSWATRTDWVRLNSDGLAF